MNRMLEYIGREPIYQPKLLATVLFCFLAYCIYQYVQYRRERNVRYKEQIIKFLWSDILLV